MAWQCTLLLQDALGHWLYVLIMSRALFRVNPHSIVDWMPRNSLHEAGARNALGHFEQVELELGWVPTTDNLLGGWYLSYLPM